MVKYQYNKKTYTVASDAGTQAGEFNDEFVLQEMCGNILLPSAIRRLYDWFDSANDHDAKQFKILFKELSEYKRDHFEEIPAMAEPNLELAETKRSSLTTRRSSNETSATDREKRAATFLMATGKSSLSSVATRNVPTTYELDYKAWGSSPRVAALLASTKSTPLIDPFSSVLSKTAKDPRMNRVLMRSTYHGDFTPQPPYTIIDKFCHEFINDTSVPAVHRWYNDVDDLRKSRLVQVARLLLKPEVRLQRPPRTASPWLKMRRPMSALRTVDVGPQARCVQTPVERAPSALSEYARGYVKKALPDYKKVKKSENTAEIPWARSFLSDDEAIRPKTVYRQSFDPLRSAAAQLPAEENQHQARAMTAWVRSGARTWGNSSLLGPSFSTKTKYAADYRPHVREGLVVALQAKWEQKFFQTADPVAILELKQKQQREVERAAREKRETETAGTFMKRQVR
eukprot:TRINITY_DN4126_c0_g1_i1.p1 TRINITY_DN4126_c0_g1~~TRINITY_DN4126_c0_g1_i1.p1  ORF type:complete len:457 (-),score=72.41 TRINITY_DN4126_c0_g1_i1:891-2261(-)